MNRTKDTLFLFAAFSVEFAGNETRSGAWKNSDDTTHFRRTGKWGLNENINEQGGVPHISHTLSVSTHVYISG